MQPMTLYGRALSRSVEFAQPQPQPQPHKFNSNKISFNELDGWFLCAYFGVDIL